MKILLPATHLGSLLLCGLLACLGLTPNCWAGGVPIDYDLEAEGPGSSYVDECQGDGSCFRLPITGRIRITTDPASPTIKNIDSDILLPPTALLAPNPFVPFSPTWWYNLDQFEGEYLFDDTGADAVIRFTPPASLSILPDGLVANLRNGFATLTLTGGINSITASPSDPQIVQFNVSGRATTVPSPAAASLAAMLACGLVTAANRWRR